ncbi:PQQ-dependent sugar dehydrogenase [Segetibacter koreensis]|uniref:PQQ-dependent sugar dehydrogenase n=1 Tax=Segetibacter koreensis TaxID=398037 RepID=UPI00146CF544|nr:PQQ-dependent sugar dehydrogenase [Segetibacter koreensis]
MKKRILVILTVWFLFYCSACNSVNSANNNISTDSVTINKGEISFNQHCSGCHNFSQDGIGPQLGGLTTKVSAEWIEHFIKDPQSVIKSGDERAKQLYKKYRTFMPSFPTFTNDELNQIVSFLNTHKLPATKVTKEDGKELSDPIPGKIKSSNLVVEMKEVTQFPPSSDSGKLPLTRITKLDYQPNTGTSFVLDLRGKLYKLQDNKPSVYMDMAKLKPKFVNEPGLATGFGSFAFHPQFATNGLIYTTHTEPPGSAKADFAYPDSIKVTLQWVLTEWKADNPAAATFSGKGRELFRVNMVAGIHGVQEITFNPLAKPGNEDYGLLYIGIGDGGSVENGFPFLTHSREKIWGTTIRINPTGKNSRNGQYGIPPQNPFTKSQNSKDLGEIYAYGFRNPHRITWSKSGRMLVCNIGHGNIESVNLVMKGHDYGWPVREGSFVLNPYGELNKVYPLPVNDSSYHITYPIAEYDHDEGKAISGGFEYSGTSIPELKGKYLFGDIPTGRLFYIDMSDVKQGRQAIIKEWNISVDGKVKTLTELCGTGRVDVHFGRDSRGELYLLTKPDGKLYKLISATKTPVSAL